MRDQLPVFQSADAYPFLKPLQDNWQAIRDEFLLYREQAELWHMKELHNEHWRLYFLVHQYQKQAGWDNCPVTRELIKDIPGLYLAGFSIMEPGCVIHPHRGYTPGVWRSHLGLICPGNAYLQIKNSRYHWQEGHAMVFDDIKRHNAVNESNNERVILMVDFAK
jgi:beta-hydroxylase